VIEAYRMLGSEHEADLEREARRRALARIAAPRRAGASRIRSVAQRLRMAGSNGYTFTRALSLKLHGDD
jgi:hypothetical protein